MMQCIFLFETYVGRRTGVCQPVNDVAFLMTTKRTASPCKGMVRCARTLVAFQCDVCPPHPPPVQKGRYLRREVTELLWMVATSSYGQGTACPRNARRTLPPPLEMLCTTDG